MVERIAGKVFTLASDGDASGYAAITSNTGAYPGSVGRIIKSDGTLSQKILLTELNGADKVGVRFLPEDINDVKLRQGTVKYPMEGRSSLVAYATGSFICIEDQLVPVRQPIFDPVPKI